MSSIQTRRGFLKLASAAAPWVVGAAAMGREGAAPASDRITMGCIGIGGRGRANLEAFVASSDSRVVAAYANGVKLGITHPLIENDWAVRFEGTEGWLLVTRNKLFASRPSLLEPLRPTETPLPRSDNHYQNFLDAVRTRQQPIAPPEVAHRSTTVCHLAVLCLRLGRPLRWDSGKEQVVGDADANRMLHRPLREPWAL